MRAFLKGRPTEVSSIELQTKCPQMAFSVFSQMHFPIDFTFFSFNLSFVHIFIHSEVTVGCEGCVSSVTVHVMQRVDKISISTLICTFSWQTVLYRGNLIPQIAPMEEEDWL